MKNTWVYNEPVSTLLIEAKSGDFRFKFWHFCTA